jgi:hypothetical protein
MTWSRGRLYGYIDYETVTLCHIPLLHRTLYDLYDFRLRSLFFGNCGASHSRVLCPITDGNETKLLRLQSHLRSNGDLIRGAYSRPQYAAHPSLLPPPSILPVRYSSLSLVIGSFSPPSFDPNTPPPSSMPINPASAYVFPPIVLGATCHIASIVHLAPGADRLDRREHQDRHSSLFLSYCLAHLDYLSPHPPG